MARIELVQTDYNPAVTLFIWQDPEASYPNQPQPIDLSATTGVNLLIQTQSDDALLQTMAGTLLTGGVCNDGTIDTTVTTAGKGGRVSFTFTNAIMAALGNGYFDGQVQLVYAASPTLLLRERLKLHIKASY